MTCPFCSNKAHPDAARDLEDDHKKLHEYWNYSYTRTACPNEGRRNTVRTCNKYAAQLGFFMDDTYRALHGKKPRLSKPPALFRFVKFLVATAKIVKTPNSMLALLTNKKFIEYLACARVDREKNESGETITLWSTMSIHGTKNSDTHMSDTNLRRRVDSKNSIRSPITHYIRMQRGMKRASREETALLRFPGLLAKNEECKRLTALRKANVQNLSRAVFKRARPHESLASGKRAKIAGTLHESPPPAATLQRVA